MISIGYGSPPCTPLLGARVTLLPIRKPQLHFGHQHQITVHEIGSGSRPGWQVAVDEGGALSECDETNNTDDYEDALCP